MKSINGLYISLILIMFITLSNQTFFQNEYAGIAMFLSTGVFIVGTLFYINAAQDKKSS